MITQVKANKNPSISELKKTQIIRLIHNAYIHEPEMITNRFTIHQSLPVFSTTPGTLTLVDFVSVKILREYFTYHQRIFVQKLQFTIPQVNFLPEVGAMPDHDVSPPCQHYQEFQGLLLHGQFLSHRHHQTKN